MDEQMTRQNEFLIVLVEDDPRQRKKMKAILTTSFSNCQVQTLANGIEAINYLLTPINRYHLVILDGHLDRYSKTFFTKINGPDVAEAMQERNIKVPIVLWTDAPEMLERFDQIYGKRLPEIEKPCRRSNVEAVLSPVISAIKDSLQVNKANKDDNLGDIDSEDQQYGSGVRGI